MKLPKFSMATLMLLITIAAIMFASVVAWQKIATISAGHSIPMPLLAHLYNYVATASYWVPFGFLGYAIGRRRLSLWIVLALGIAQAAALFAEYILVISR